MPKAAKAYMLVMYLIWPLVVQETPVYEPSQGSLELQVAKAAPTKSALNAFAQATADMWHSLLALYFFSKRNNKYDSRSPDPVRVAALARPKASRVTHSQMKRMCRPESCISCLNPHDPSAKVAM